MEKPDPANSPSNIAVVGRYILTPEVFTELENINPGIGGEYQLTDALARVASRSKVLAVKFAGQRFDCGSMEGFVAATNFTYNARFQVNTSMGRLRISPNP